MIYAPAFDIVKILKKFRGKVSIDYLVSKTSYKRSDIMETLRFLEGAGVVRLEGKMVFYRKEADLPIDHDIFED